MLRDSLPLFDMPLLFMALVVVLWGFFYLLPLSLTHRFMVHRARAVGKKPQKAVSWIFRSALVVSFVVHWVMCADLFEREACVADGKSVWTDAGCVARPETPT